MTMRLTNQISFKGYDARPIKGFLMNSNCMGIAEEMQKIGDKEGFDIYSYIDDENGGRCKKGIPPRTKGFYWAWAQDYWTIVKEKLFAKDPDCITNSIKNFFNLKFDETQISKRQELLDNNTGKNLDNYILSHSHISGGNIFLVKDKDSDIALVGEDELEKFSIENIKKMYGVSKVIPLPQTDYHIDMFIRPLDNKRILLADDQLTIEMMDYFLQKTKGYHDTNLKVKFAKFDFECYNSSVNKLPKTQDVEKVLKENGFEVIKVPGRIYVTYPPKEMEKTQSLEYILNFLNANVFVNPNGDLVYITNKSDMDSIFGLTPEIKEEIGGGVEDYFKNVISPYIKPEHIYFVDGDDNFVSKKMLKKFDGGIHCACSEIPEE